MKRFTRLAAVLAAVLVLPACAHGTGSLARVTVFVFRFST